MKLPLILRPEAELDIVSAREWYDDRLAGLGDRFVVQVSDALVRISERPEMFQLVHGVVRATRVRRFPYTVY